MYSCFGSEGELEWKSVSIYDDQGNYLGYDDYGGNGELIISVRE